MTSESYAVTQSFSLPLWIKAIDPTALLNLKKPTAALEGDAAGEFIQSFRRKN